jgi:hypothetical protein
MTQRCTYCGAFLSSPCKSVNQWENCKNNEENNNAVFKIKLNENEEKQLIIG